MDTPSSDPDPHAPAEFKPGDTISPAAVQPSSVPQVTQPEIPLPSTPAQQPVEPAGPEPSPQPSQEPDSAPAFSFRQEGVPAPVLSASAEPEISWTASEFISHEKSTGWYLALGLASVLGAIIVFTIFRDWVTTSVILMAGLALGVYGGWRPKQQQYGLTASGLSVGQRFFAYEDFRSFSVVDEGAFTSIQFTPLKRFGTPVSIYYDPKDEEAILNLLSVRLPMEETHADAVDRLMKRIRF